MLVAHPSLPVESQATHATHAVEQRVAGVGIVEIDSTRLLQGQRELYIRHGNECYRLRHTRNDKLILTK
jgi:hemin uptake protein HemP